jgi:hypothetical protein
VPRDQRDGSLRPYSQISREEPLLFYQVAPQFLVILPAALDPGVYSASNKNEYKKQKNNISWQQRRIFLVLMQAMGHALAWWLRHYDTNRKVMGLGREVTEFFNLHNPSCRTRPWGLLSQ